MKKKKTHTSHKSLSKTKPCFTLRCQRHIPCAAPTLGAATGQGCSSRPPPCPTQLPPFCSQHWASRSAGGPRAAPAGWQRPPPHTARVPWQPWACLARRRHSAPTRVSTSASSLTASPTASPWASAALDTTALPLRAALFPHPLLPCYGWPPCCGAWSRVPSLGAMREGGRAPLSLGCFTSTGSMPSPALLHVISW